MKRISIKIKFGALVGLLIAGIIIAISSVLLNQEKKELIKRIKSQGFLMAKKLASSSAEGITTSDQLTIFQAVEDAVKEEGILDAFILNPHGEVIAHTNHNEIGKIYDVIKWNANYKGDKDKIKPRLFKYKNQKAYDFLFPIEAKTFRHGKVKEVNIGTAHILFSYKIIDKAINNATASIVILSLVIFVIGIGASFLLTQFIVHPIMSIAKGAEEIGKGNLEYKIAVHTKDELEFLSNQFNIMTGKLAQAQAAMLERERLKYELDIATSVQESLIPKKIPRIKNLNISAYYRPAKEIGGDYYDFYKLDKDRLAFIVADVSGKGVPGAMVMAMVRSILKSTVYNSKTAFHTMLKTNRLITGDIKSGMFITAFYGIINATNLKLEYINAGHNQLLILKNSTGKVESIQDEGIPLGTPNIDVFENRLKAKFIQLQRGDVIIQYTDGITEAKNERQDEYELKRLISTIENNKTQLPAAMLKAVIVDVNKFCDKEPQYDDIAIVIIKV